MYSWLKRHIIPHKSNDYKPHLLEEAAMGGLLVLVLLSFAIATMQSLIWVTSDWMVGAILPAVIVAETNEERIDDALPILFRNETLDAAAQLKAEHMAKEEYFAHYSPDGVSPWYWFDQVSYEYLHAGENLAIHFTDSDEVVDAWMDSPAHRANILNGDYYEIGIGTARGEYEGYPTIFVVQLFGTPQAEVLVVEDAVTKNTPSGESVELATVPVVSDGGVVLAAENEDAESAPIVPAPTPEPVLVVEAPVVEVLPERTPEPAAVATVIESSEIEVPAPTPDRDVIVLDLISTTTAGAVGMTESFTDRGETTKPSLAFMTQPFQVLQFLYVVIGLAVAVTLALSIVIEARRQHPLHVVYSTGLMATMVLLLFVHLSISGGVLIA